MNVPLTLTPQEVVDQYVETCAILKETTFIGDYKRGNREYKKIIKVFKYLENNISIAYASLPTLFSHENVAARIKAAAHCLALNIAVDEAQKVLQDAANDETNSIFAFEAKLTLQKWSEQGYLLVHQK